MAQESYRSRQENELLVLQSIFTDSLIDYRCKETGSSQWKPLDLSIQLYPQKGSNIRQEVYAQTKFRVHCAPKYPKILPKFSIEEPKGLSDYQVIELTEKLQVQAMELKGEVMIYELCQTIEAFLYANNRPPPGSFYEQMVAERQERTATERRLLIEKKEAESQAIRDEVARRKEQLKAESKPREQSITIEPIYLTNDLCTEHRHTECLYVPTSGRKIQRGQCLGHSDRGCVTYGAMDLDTGQLLYVTEWSCKYNEMNTKCLSNCGRCNELGQCPGHPIDEIVQGIEKRVQFLSTLRHKNLIPYECCLCLRRKDTLTVYLMQDFCPGTTLAGLTDYLRLCSDAISLIARNILDALTYLHNKGVSHGNLYERNIFLDRTGTIRISDFAIIPYLQHLTAVTGQRIDGPDLPAVGMLIDGLSTVRLADHQDFIDQCQSERTISASDLLEHPFLRPGINSETLTVTRRESVVPKSNKNEPVAIATSRIENEFEWMAFLGKGAYGDVLKCRNKLDNRQYAIKRIPLTVGSRQIFKKMTREVELLSRLNHENIVRYYNSWIETIRLADWEREQRNLGLQSEHSSNRQTKPSQIIEVTERLTSESSSDSSDWLNGPIRRHQTDSTTSDDVEFVDSNGVIIQTEEQDNPPSERSVQLIERTDIQIMYIQMEFCEKSTLRNAIDEGLYKETERLWRLFREIVEGLYHIHQQGMIHRDLKPVNIFLDSRDQVKIGDFGLATTSFLALQSQEPPLVTEQTGSLTGKVGTALYVAPELTGLASKSTYNQKVDLYSLGIILFEMSYPKFDTGMERVQIIAALRTPAVVIPDFMQADTKYRKNVEVIRWLLRHDPHQRPTAEELLASELVPPAQLEASELQEMLRNVLTSPQSKSYKHLVERCLAQESDTVLQLTYHMGLVQKSTMVEWLKSKIIKLFRLHGAIEVVTPILTPYVRTDNTNLVKLMTHSGSVICLPYDMRIPFAKHVVHNGITSMRRYAVGRVYREKKRFNFHPKQLYECGFDIVTVMPDNDVIDAELISIAYEITNEIVELRQTNISFRINHTGILYAILQHNGVPPDRYQQLFGMLKDHLSGRISNFQFRSFVSAMLACKQRTNQLVEMLLCECPISGSRGSINGTMLKIIGKGRTSEAAHNAWQQLQKIVQLAQGFGVTCQINVFAGLPPPYDHFQPDYGGIVWNMLSDVKGKGFSSQPQPLAIGIRYDGILAVYQKQSQLFSTFSKTNRPRYGSGFSFQIDKIIGVIKGRRKLDESTTDNQNIDYRSIDAIVCLTGGYPKHPMNVPPILRTLWSAGNRAIFSETCQSADEAVDLAKEIGAKHVVAVEEDGTLRVRSSFQDRFQEFYVHRSELIDHIQRMGIKPETPSPNNSFDTIGSLKNQFPVSGPTLPIISVTFLTHEKLTTNMKRRYESQMRQHMSESLVAFERKEKITVLLIELPGPILRAICGIIDPRDPRNCTDDLAYICERNAKHKRYIGQIVEEICDVITSKRDPNIVSLYSILDTSYRIVI